MADINLYIDNYLTLDFLEERIDSGINISKEPEISNSSVYNIQTKKGIFDPDTVGTYKLEYEGDSITINVYDIPSSSLTEDLLAWYRFEDGDARDYASSSEYPNITWGDSTAYDGSVSNAIHKPNSGIRDFKENINSGAFDTSTNNTDSINFPDSFVPSGNSTRTTMCWVKVFGGTGDRQMAVGYGNGNNSQSWEMEVYRVYNKGNGQVTGALNIHTWAGYNRTDADVISLNEWIHFAATHDGNPSNIQIYLNGQPVKTYNNNDDSASLNTATSNHITGYSPSHGNGQHTFNGIIDDYRVYNRDLTDSEIADIYDMTKP